MIETSEDVWQVVEPLMRESTEYSDAGQHEEALRLADVLLAEHGSELGTQDQAVMELFRGRELVSLGRYEDGGRAFQRCLKLAREGTPGRPGMAVEALSWLAYALYKLERLDDAERVLVRIIDRYGHRTDPVTARFVIEALGNRGKQQERRGDYTGARASYASAIELARGSTDADVRDLARRLRSEQWILRLRTLAPQRWRSRP